MSSQNLKPQFENSNKSTSANHFPSSKALALYALALFSLSLSPILVRFAHTPPESVGALRMLVASLALALWMLLQKSPNTDRSQPKKWVGFAWMFGAGLFFFLHLWSYKFAALHTQVANLMILFSTNPLWTALGAFVLLGHRLTRTAAASFALAFTGILLLFANQMSFDPTHRTGNLAALATAFFYSATLLCSLNARKHWPNRVFSFGMYSLTALFFWILCFYRGQQPFDADPQTWLSVLGLVIFPTLLGHFLFTSLIHQLDINLMSCGKLIEPVISSALAAWLFGEALQGQTVLAFILTSSGVLLFLRGKK